VLGVRKPGEIDSKRLDLIDELLKGQSVKEAAAKAGVSKRTAEKWMGMTPFRDELSKRMRSTLDVYVVRALQGGLVAQSKQIEILTSQPPAKSSPMEVIRHQELVLRAAMALGASADRLSVHPTLNPDAPTDHRPLVVLPAGARIAMLVEGVTQTIPVRRRLPAPDVDVTDVEAEEVE